MKDKLITIGAIIGFLSYSAPYMLNYISPSKYDFIFFDKFSMIGTCLGFGGILLSLSIDLKTTNHFIYAFISIFFLGLFVTFSINQLFNQNFRTSPLVFFNIIISLLCLSYLLYRKQRPQ